MKYMTDMHEQQDSWALKNSVGGPELKGISKMIYSMKTITETTQFGNLEMRQGAFANAERMALAECLELNGVQFSVIQPNPFAPKHQGSNRLYLTEETLEVLFLARRIVDVWASHIKHIKYSNIGENRPWFII